MKTIPLFLCLALLFTGCVSKKEKQAAIGPLSEIKDYVVVPIFLPHQTSDKEILFSHLVESLRKLGTVEISANCIHNIFPSSAGLIISLSEYETSKSGSIKIFAEGEVLLNKHKTSCDIWTTTFLDPTASYPVDGEGGIIFKTDPSAMSPDLKEVIAQMVAQFSEQYRQDNFRSKPTFHVYKPGP